MHFEHAIACGGERQDCSSVYGHLISAYLTADGFSTNRLLVLDYADPVEKIRPKNYERTAVIAAAEGGGLAAPVGHTFLRRNGEITPTR